MTETLFSKRLASKGFLIMSHRGLWGGNIIENTIESAVLAFKAGADIVEVDICRTTDGDYYLFHDGNEPSLLGRNENFKTLSTKEVEENDVYNSIGSVSGYKINTLSQFLDWLPEGQLVNIDRSWDYWDDSHFFDLLKQSGKSNQLVLKSPVDDDVLRLFSQNGKGFYYIPITKTVEEYERVASYADIQMIGAELIVEQLNSELLDTHWLNKVKEKGQFTVANAENLGESFHLFAGLSDDTALFEDGHWDSFLKAGIDVIQTDWPMFLNDYREQLKKGE